MKSKADTCRDLWSLIEPLSVQQPTSDLPDLTEGRLRALSEDLRRATLLPGQSVERCDPDAPRPAVERRLEVPPGSIVYRLQLREGVWIEWALPVDLGHADVERIRVLLDVLPVDDDEVGRALVAGPSQGEVAATLFVEGRT